MKTAINAAQKLSARGEWIRVRIVQRCNAKSLRWLLLCIFVAATNAQGQSSGVIRQSELAQALGKTRERESLRVRAESGLFEGQMAAITADSLHLRTETGIIVAVPARSVRNVWVRRNVRSEAAGIGAMMGAILGAGLGTVARNKACDPLTGCGDNIPLKLVAGTAAGGIAGGLIGALIGGTRRHWAQIFPD